MIWRGDHSTWRAVQDRGRVGGVKRDGDGWRWRDGEAERRRRDRGSPRVGAGDPNSPILPSSTTLDYSPRTLSIMQFPGVAVVTGAASGLSLPPMRTALTVPGIGAAVAKGFAAAGCERIAITDINPDALDRTRREVSSIYPYVRLLAKEGNIAEESFVESFISQVLKEFGRLDYAVNCAGILGEARRSTDTTADYFDHINSINYRGCWLSSRAELRQMVSQDPLPSHDPDRAPQRGAVVNISSQLGIVGRPNARKHPLGIHWISLISTPSGVL